MYDPRPVKAFLKAKLSFYKQELLLSKPNILVIKAQLLSNIPGNKSLNHIRLIRNWVNSNSIHLIDEEHDRYAFKIDKVIPMLWAAFCHNNQKPHLSCGPRSYAMKEILDWYGIRSRIIDIFHINGTKVNPHTLLEVYCPEEDVWVLQDPDFNVEYIHGGSLRPADTWSLISRGSIPIHHNNNGFIIENIENCLNTIKNCFDLGVLYRYSYDGKKSNLQLTTADCLDSTVIVNKNPISFISYINNRAAFPDIRISQS